MLLGKFDKSCKTILCLPQKKKYSCAGALSFWEEYESKGRIHLYKQAAHGGDWNIRSRLLKIPKQISDLARFPVSSKSRQKWSLQKWTFLCCSPPQVSVWLEAASHAFNQLDVNPGDFCQSVSQIPSVHQHPAWDPCWATCRNSINSIALIPRSPDPYICGCLSMWEYSRPLKRIPKSTGFSSWPAFPALLLLNCLHKDCSSCVKEGGAAGIPLMLVRVLWVCVQGRRGVLYMTRRFHSNVIRLS